MVEAHSSSIEPLRLPGHAGHAGHPRAPSVPAMLDALHIPAAILAKSGEVLAANAAWEAAWPSDHEPAPALGANYLDWCRAQVWDGVSLAGGVERVLSGRSKAWEQTCRPGQTAPPLCVRVRAIERTAPGRFLVTHEAVGCMSAEDLEDRVLAAQMEERERLASELHDSVGQNLVCLGLGLTRLRRAAEPEVEGIVGEMTQSLQQAHAEIRTLSFLLQPPWLDEPEAFERALRALVAGFSRRAGLRANVRVAGGVEGLSDPHQLALFRIVQEALVNVYRHARADLVEIELLRRSRLIILKVRDNGRGMPAPEGVAPTPGAGILGMRARLRRLGGELSIVSSQDGTTITAKLPAAT